MGEHELPPNVAAALVRASEACDALDDDTNFQSKARALVQKAAEQLKRSDSGAKPTSAAEGASQMTRLCSSCRPCVTRYTTPCVQRSELQVHVAIFIRA